MIALLFAILTTLSPAQAAETNFTVGIEMPNQVPVPLAVERALKEIGIGYVNYYTRTFVNSTDRPAAETNPPLMDMCERLGIDFSFSCYEADPFEDGVAAAVAHNQNPERKSNFRGTVFDELEHIRLMNFNRPTPLVDYTKFTTLPQAWEETVAGFSKLREHHAAQGVNEVVATHVFPVLLHAAARGGFEPCPKIQKEFYSSVSLAIGMGAALQYDRSLWVDADLWHYDEVPGHSPEEFRSNLLLAYWLGAEVLYVEGAGYNLLPAGSQGTPFSLINVISPEQYQLTPHGQILRWFCREYVPAHPRQWSIKDFKPDVAIVRFEDGEYGQNFTSGFTKGLYGTENLLSTPDTRAIFQIWSTMTFGVVDELGPTYFSPAHAAWGYKFMPPEYERPSYLTRPLQSGNHRFWTPLNGVTVFDHTVTYDKLKGIPLLFLTGPAYISEETWQAIDRCVEEGAVCVVWRNLALSRGLDDKPDGITVKPKGKGRYVITDDFRYADVKQQIWWLVGNPDTIRYRFGDHTVTLHRVDDDRVRVDVDGKFED